MDLSKTRDCLHHDLLNAKLAAHGFDKTVLALITDYLTNSKLFTSTGKNRGNF